MGHAGQFRFATNRVDLVLSFRLKWLGHRSLRRKMSASCHATKFSNSAWPRRIRRRAGAALQASLGSVPPSLSPCSRTVTAGRFGAVAQQAEANADRAESLSPRDFPKPPSAAELPKWAVNERNA